MQKQLNNLWSDHLIHFLEKQGVSYMCIAPGSRSSPLAGAISKNPKVTSFVHLDERSLGFHAAGYSKASKKPVAIIVTSGTACGELLPAIMEAHHSHLPLIILTADRPPELQETGSNQTTHQVSMFSNYVRFEMCLPCPTDAISLSYLNSTISYAVSKATGLSPGPIHLNCMFREPLIALHQPQATSFLSPIKSYSYKPSICEEDFLDIATHLSAVEKGMILAGYEACDLTSSKDLSLLADKLKWPICADIASGYRSSSFPSIHFDLLLKNPENFSKLQPDGILHVGGQLTSKKLHEWLIASKPSTYLHVSPFHERQDPSHQNTHRIVCDLSHFCRKLKYLIPFRKASCWLDTILESEKSLCEGLKEYFHEHPKLNEISLFYLLSQLDLSNFGLFISSSMPIRDADMLFFSSIPPKGIYSLRGLSGIDGIVAATIGAATAQQIPFISVIGDLAALHDISSLIQLKNLSIPPITFIIINNYGGGIFSFLEAAKEQEMCAKYLIASHEFNFQKIAEAFGLTYSLVTSSDDFLHTLSQRAKTHQIIEVQTHRDQNVIDHETLYAFLSNHAAII